MMNINLKKCSTGILKENEFAPENLHEYQKIIKTGLKNQNAYGLNTLLFVSKALKWVYKDSEWMTPIYFHEVNLEKHKGSNTPISIVENTAFINELLEARFKTLFNISVLDNEWDVFIKSQGFEVTELNIIANFDYKRYVLLRDYDAMQKVELSPILKKMESGDETEKEVPSGIDIAPIYPLDSSQIKCLEYALTNSSLVIQGPPGTGKSRTIANLIGQNLYFQKSTLFVAEKRVALEVVNRLVSSANLGHLVSIIHDSERDKKRFINELSDAWEVMSDDIRKETTIHFNFDSIAYQLDQLNKCISGTSVPYQKVIDRLISKKEKSIAIEGIDKFFFEEWCQKEAIIKQAFKQLQLFNVQSFSETPLGNIDIKILKLNQPSEKVTLFIKEILATIKELEKNQIAANFNSLNELTKASSLARILISLKEISYENLLKSSFRKRLFRLYDEYALLTLKLEQNATFLNQWKKEWTLQATEKALESLSNKSLKDVVTNKKITHQFKKDFRQEEIEIPIIDCLKEYHRLTLIAQKQQEIKTELKTKYGVDQVEQDVIYLKQLFSQIETSSSELIKTFKKERFKKEYLSKLDQLHQPIQNLQHYSSILFGGQFEQIEEIQKACLKLLAHNDLHALIDFAKNLKTQLSDQMYRQLMQLAGTFSEVDYNINKEIYNQYISKDLNYSEVTAESVELKFKHKLIEEEQYCKFNRYQILQRRKANFEAYQELLNTPAQKLSPANKKLKKELRKGKSLLIKEFTKSRSHKSIRHLYESEARHWIKVLKPVLLLSPISVSEIFPLNETFDTIIFDEASQIPIEDSLPSLQRTSQVIVTGDSKQMTPSNLFRSSIEERFSLLQFIKYELKNIMLNYHYRSQHKDLIEWSNQSFYNGEIKSTTNKNFKGNPITYFQLANNDYNQGKNLSEATEILRYLEQNLKDFRKKDCMVVTLSEVQAEYLSKKISSSDLSSSINCRVTSLEKLQGEECDIVIISLTHGPDESGKFSLNFGPINQQNGPNRINVLASRAKEKMVIFSSFKIELLQSDNLGIKTLHEFLKFALLTSNNSADKEENEEAKLNDIHLRKDNVVELYSHYKQLILANWTPKFHFTKDEL